jgi:hypothetical protein
MPATSLEIFPTQIQRPKFFQIFRAQASKFIQQLIHRLALTLLYVSPTIEGLERSSLAELQEHSRARHPIRAFGMNQMGNDIEDAPGVFTLILEGPHFREVTQERIESAGRASKKGYSLWQIVFHRDPPFDLAIRDFQRPRL